MTRTPPIAVVTGAGRGIGDAIVTRLRADGWHVIGVDRAFTESAVDDRLIHDLARLDTLAALAARIEALGAPMALVHCAGIASVGSFADSDPADWRALIDVNLLAPMAITHALLPGMIAAGHGAIVGITSESARVGASGEAAYSASKGGLASFLRSLAQEVGRFGITVNAVSPGPVRSPLSDGQPELKARLARRTPLRRVAEPEDVAAMVAFLLGRDGAFVTGQTMSVSGGLTMVP